jgi:hypothetical protein
VVRTYLPVVLGFKCALLVTCTLKKVSACDVRAEKNRIMICFRKLRRRKVWNAEKGVFSVEIIKKKGSWYIHLHALVDSEWMSRKALSETWKEITGDSFIVDVRKIKGDLRSGLREVLKYQTKMWELNDEEKEFVEKTFKHSRFVNSFGIKKPEKSVFEMICQYRLSSGKICGGALKPYDEELNSS